MSDRIGANRAYLRIPFTQVKLVWWGLFHGLADGLKMLLKEDWKPEYLRQARLRDRAVGRVRAGAARLRGDPVRRHAAPRRSCSRRFPRSPPGSATAPTRCRSRGSMRASSSCSRSAASAIIGAMLAGWSSSNKFSLLGALRAGSQMISYELIMGLTVLGLIVVYGTVDLRAIAQQQSGVLFGFLPAWGIFYQPFAADPVPHRGHRREQAHPVRPAGGGVGAHRGLLHRVQRDEDGPLHVRRVHRDRDHRGAVHDAVPRRLQPAVHDRRRLRAARRRQRSP